MLAVRAAAENVAVPRCGSALREAVYLAATGALTRDVRLLARAPGDRRRLGAP